MNIKETSPNKNRKVNPMSDEEGFKLYGDKWLDPLFRQEITGVPFDIDAHMDFGNLTYRNKLGEDVDKIWYRRNIDGQGHPFEEDYLKAIRSQKSQSQDKEKK